MKQLFKRLAAGCAALAFTVCAALPALAAPKIDTATAVNDTAGVLSQDTEIYVNNITIALQDSCGAQIGVYTVDHIGNNTMEGYAYDVLNQWGLGDAQTDNGVLLLLAPGDDDYYITRGTGLANQLTVSVLSTILDGKMEPNWVSGDYDAAVQQTVLAVGERLCRIYGLTMDVDAVGRGESSGSSTGSKAGGPLSTGMGKVVFVIALILIAVLLVFLLRKPRRKDPPGSGPRPPEPPRYQEPRRSGAHDVGNALFWYGMGRASSRRRTPPPPPPPRGGSPFGGMGGPGGPRPGGSRSGSFGGSSRPSGGGFRSGGGSFRAGGGSSRGGGVGRHH